MINRDIGEQHGFSGGAEDTPIVAVGTFNAKGSLNNGKKNLIIEQNGQIVQLSIETMKIIIEWAANNNSSIAPQT